MKIISKSRLLIASSIILSILAGHAHAALIKRKDVFKENAGYIYSQSSSKNVGIGTNIPTAKLEVNGTIKASGMQVGSNALCQSDGTNCPATSAPAGSGSELQYRVGASSLGAVTGSSVSGSNIGIGTTIATNGVLLVMNGNVGIGTWKPSQLLEVKGTILANALSGPLTGNASTATALANNGSNCSSGQYAQGVDASGNAEGCAASGSSQWATSGSNIYYSSGNVGIGTISPQDNLTVNGAFGSFIPGTSPSGGTITTNGANTVHTFTSGGTFTLTNNGTVTYLVAAGGGAGGTGGESPFGGAGGGGAGGILSGTLSLTAGSYTVTIGAGGLHTATAANRGGDGGNSVFASITTTGGGGGGGPAQSSGDSGGSGGGGSAVGGSGGAGTSGQGNAGGAGAPSSSGNKPGGGGGGAGGVGADSSGTSVGGAGGSGVSNSISGSATTYGCGGGGGTYNGGSPGSGGCGSAGNGGAFSAGSNASANRGGGGGGGGNNAGTPQIGGDGGSGIVVISYATSSQGGNKIVRATSGAALAVNTQTPLSQADINGNMSVGSSYAGIVAAPADGMIVQGNTGIGTSNPSTLFEVGSKKFNVTSGGNVGMGTIAPQALLAVGSTGQFQVDSTGHITSVGGSSGHVKCWKTASTEGYCSTQPDTSGNCTCN